MQHFSRHILSNISTKNHLNFQVLFYAKFPLINSSVHISGLDLEKIEIKKKRDKEQREG